MRYFLFAFALLGAASPAMACMNPHSDPGLLAQTLGVGNDPVNDGGENFLDGCIIGIGRRNGGGGGAGGGLPGPGPIGGVEFEATDRLDGAHAFISGSNESYGDARETLVAAPLGVDGALVLTQAARATSAGQLRRLADQARAAGRQDVASQIERMEDEACGSFLRDDIGAHINRESEGFRRLVDFCASAMLDSGLDPRAVRSELLQARFADTEQALEEFAARAIDQDLARAFMDLVVDSQYPAEIDALASVITQWYTDHDAIIPLASEPQYLDQFHARRIHRTALEIYSCQRFGHCGPESWPAIEACLVSPGCEPGQGYLELISHDMTPRDFDRARDIADRLRQHERAGSG